MIALSLILSLMSYSPAPLYILDEVDAAVSLESMRRGMDGRTVADLGFDVVYSWIFNTRQTLVV